MWLPRGKLKTTFFKFQRRSSRPTEPMQRGSECLIQCLHDLNADAPTINQVPYGAIVGSAKVAGLGGHSVIEHSPCHPRENTRTNDQNFSE